METEIKLKAYKLMCAAKAMTDIYEENRHICKYVHSTSRGHEAIQLATAFHLLPCDYVSPYYRDESMLLGLGFSPYTLMLQLLAKKDDIFSGGREYYSHPSYRGDDKPDIIHQSSATGMQVIPATGIAHGFEYLKSIGSPKYKTGPNGEHPIVVCSLGDASVTEGEVSEAFQAAVLHHLPIVFLIQDNDWGISVTAGEARKMNAFEYAGGFSGLNRVSIDGSDFESSYNVVDYIFREVRDGKGPYLIRAVVPLLGHHTSGVRREFYRSQEDLKKHALDDPLPKLRKDLLSSGIDDQMLNSIEIQEIIKVKKDFDRAVKSADPDVNEITEHIFADTYVKKESGIREPVDRTEKIMMVDAALFAIREIMSEHPEAVVYGQDVGQRLGGVFRETATLGRLFGDHRVFNTAIQEAYIIGSTVGMSAVGVRPIVEVQFADYVYPGLNQLATEVAKSCYLSNGKYPVSTVIRIPCGAYSGGGPYHSASIESLLLSIKGIKIAYPSNAADMKGLMKAAYYDPNPVIMLEHKGLYWSKVPGTEQARTVEPDKDYILPFGKGNVVLEADKIFVDDGDSCCVITYGMGVYWALAAAKEYKGRVEIIDLRTLYPLDEDLIYTVVKKHGKVVIVTEEQKTNSFAEALAGRISSECFQWLDAPIKVVGAVDLPAVPLNETLEEAMLPGESGVSKAIRELLTF